MGDYYFVSPETGHPLAKVFKPFDFRFWYDGKKGLIEPILACTISAPDWNPILSSGATSWLADKGTVMAAGELKYGKGVFRICEVQLADRIGFNPTALIFSNNEWILIFLIHQRAPKQYLYIISIMSLSSTPPRSQYKHQNIS